MNKERINAIAEQVAKDMLGDITQLEVKKTPASIEASLLPTEEYAVFMTYMVQHMRLLNQQSGEK